MIKRCGMTIEQCKNSFNIGTWDSNNDNPKKANGCYKNKNNNYYFGMIGRVDASDGAFDTTCTKQQLGPDYTRVTIDDYASNKLLENKKTSLGVNENINNIFTDVRTLDDYITSKTCLLYTSDAADE